MDLRTLYENEDLGTKEGRAILKVITGETLFFERNSNPNRSQIKKLNKILTIMETISIEDIADLTSEQLLEVRYTGMGVVSNISDCLNKYGYHLKDGQEFEKFSKSFKEEKVNNCINYLESQGYMTIKAKSDVFRTKEKLKKLKDNLTGLEEENTLDLKSFEKSLDEIIEQKGNTYLLVEDKDLYNQFENIMNNIYFDIHAIYEPELEKPDLKTNPFGDCYCCAADLFAPGFTFRIYFKIKNDTIVIEDVDRWHFG